MTTTLAPRDAERLADLEVTIALGLTTFVEVGSALAEIREKRLYRETHGSFEHYCGAKWQMTPQHAGRLIGAAQIVGNLEPMGSIPATERVARPLAALEPEQQREVWKEAVDTAPAKGVTAKHVANTAKRLFIDKPASPPPIPIRRDVVTETVAAAKAEFRNSEDGRLSAYIVALPPVPGGIGEVAFSGLHVSGLEILRIHAAFINRAIAQRERFNATAG